MRKSSALLILIAFLVSMLSACSQVKENIRPQSEISLPRIGEPIADKNSAVSNKLNMKLHFLDLSQTSLVAEMRELSLSQGENIAKRAVLELISGSEEYGHTQIALPGVKVMDVLVNKDIASVYLSADTIPESEKRYYFECTVTNTLIDILNISYVNIFWNGHIEEENIFGLRTTSEDNIAQEYLEKSSIKESSSAEAAAATEEKAAVYFAAGYYKLYLPEVKTISVKKKDYVTALFNALKEGSNDKANRAEIFSDGVKLLSYSIGDIAGQNIITLTLDKLPAFFGYQDSDSINAFYASLILTLNANIPKIDGMRIVSVKEHFEGKIITTKEFMPSHGSEITVFLQKAGEEALIPVVRLITTASLYDIKARLMELMKGPTTSEAQSVLPVFPSGVSGDDILDAYISEDIAYISINRNFYDQLKAMSNQNGRLLIYSMVSTAAQAGAKKARFLLEGKSIDNTVSTINLSNSLLENPGLTSID